MPKEGSRMSCHFGDSTDIKDAFRYYVNLVEFLISFALFDGFNTTTSLSVKLFQSSHEYIRHYTTSELASYSLPETTCLLQ